MRLSRSSLAVPAALALLFGAVLVVQRGSGKAPRFDGGRFVTGLQAYVRDLAARGEPVPPSIALESLVGSGHLQPADLQPFEDARVVVHTDADESRPQSLLMEAWMPDGSVLAVLSDGSVQSMSRKRFAEYQKQPGQPRAISPGQ